MKNLWKFLGITEVALASFLPLKNKAQNYDVLYAKNPEIEELSEYRGQIGRLLGPKIENKLQIVKGNEFYAIIYDRNTSKENAENTSTNHSKILEKAGLEKAIAIKDEGYEPLFNISYGVGPNLEIQKENFAKVNKILGEGVGKNLVIEKTLYENYALVYKKLGDKRSTYEVAKKHSKLLRKKGIKTDIILEKNNEIIFGESSYLNELIEKDIEVKNNKIKKNSSQKQIVGISKDSLPIKTILESNLTLYNVSYGVGPNLEKQKRNLESIKRKLGKNAEEHLVIEETNSGNYAIVYKKLEDKKSVYDLAKKHSKILKMPANIILEKNNKIILGDAKYTNQIQPISKINKESLASLDTAKKSLESKILRESDLNSKFKSLEVSKNGFEHSKTPFSKEFAHNLEKKVADLVEGKIKKGDKTGWFVEYLGNIDDTLQDFPIEIVSINEKNPMQSASMIKIIELLIFFNQVENGKLKYDSNSKKKLHEMMSNSNYTASNLCSQWILNQVGGPEKAQEILDSNYNFIFQNTKIAESIPDNGQTYLNKASPEDYACFLSELWARRLPYSNEILKLMALPNGDRIYQGVKKIPSGTLVYDKTGTTGKQCGNTGILVVKDKNNHRHAYSITGIIERAENGKDYTSWVWSRGNIIRNVSGLVYDELKKELDLK